ncbi:putative response regulator [Candidatus Kuenenia stuttgartiensis]|jgi:DNA-binding NtrC family response regulator|uniref:Putative response regulator n=1 Tax=Kuenenia stuttgartiensis TaxID=174633 RepID=Q1PZK2_KUEST|nr:MULTISPECIES: response regulator [Kuenenia]MBE7546692.1 response regulator [Planctomycetia bacterium]MBW7940895.1 response regulator [Candidatus Kuenenia stuttgartiensis]MBZ0190313.1 response regulator [Candidatus Kuenenia stuttgartiensis]MCF6150943.1 response regulator [Candidatus Kuenenia stuttgartiensis]MCL4725910.1 response regulator [Candidatus Kuenenia stuttgartiensis]
MVALYHPDADSFSLLITDDDKSCRDSLREILELKGYTTYLASCGREAIKIARSEELHVLILDAHLPDYSGLETFNIIKKEISISIPCIFISGDISKELQINLINANAYTLIPKPINVNIFRDSVEQVIEKYYWK